MAFAGALPERDTPATTMRFPPRKSATDGGSGGMGAFGCLTISSSAAKRKERERLTMSPLQRVVRLADAAMTGNAVTVCADE
jgi:hypothetical protein